MNRRGGVAALMALAMATFVYLAYVSGVGNMYLPSESVASTTSSPVGRVAIPARIANPSPSGASAVRRREPRTRSPSHVRVRRRRLRPS